MCQACGNSSLIHHAEAKQIYDDFVNLHLHSSYSLLDGLSKLEDVVKKVGSLKQKSFAVTEHGNVFSAVKAHKLAKEAGIKHIYGAEFYITENRFLKDKEKKYYHLTVLAKNEQGRLNINKLSSLGYLEGFYFKPRIDHELLEKYSEGLIVMSGCMGSEAQQALAGGKIGDGDINITEYTIANARKIVKWYRNVFGEDYYLEVQAHRDFRQQKLNRAIYDLGIELGIDVVATTDSHFVDEEDHELHSIFIQIGTNREAGETYEDTHIMGAKEVIEKLQSPLGLTYEEAEKATKMSLVISDKCNAELPLSEPIIPQVDVPEGYDTELAYLKELINQGWKKRKIHKKSKEDIKIYNDRLMYEFNAISKMGFEGYFLFVHSYVNSVRRRGIARGSAGGSLIAYLLSITEIDPIPYGLYFERFIDVSAVELLESGAITKKELKIPDVDSDFSKRDREKVVDYIIERYGQEKFANLGSFQYIWDKSAIKDVGRVLDVPYAIRNKITQTLGDATIEYALETGMLSEYVEQYPKLFEYAKKLAGTPRSFSTHACFTAGHKIKTVHGYKNIEDIIIGDFVLTHNGNYKKVVDVMESESNNIYNLDVMGFRNITTTGNHPFYAKRRLNPRKKEYGEPDWMTVKQLDKGDMVGIPVNNKAELPQSFNLPVDSTDFWWVIGRFVGDGWATHIEKTNEVRTEICCSKFKNELEDILKRYDTLGLKYRFQEKESTHTIITNDKEFNKFCSNFGKYAHGKKIPNFVLDLPVKHLSFFLKGYFSADGYVNKDGYQQCKTVSEELALGLQKCIHKVYRRHVGITTVMAREEVIEGRTVQSREKYVLTFKAWDSPKDRTHYKNGFMWIPVKGKFFFGDKHKSTVYNLTVLDDSSYTVENIAVHNCGKIVTIKDVDWYMPVAVTDKGVTIQGDMHDAEDLGAVKADVLGLKSLDVIYDCLDMINKDYDYISPDLLNFKDPKVLGLFRSGATDGVFQFE